MNAQVREEWPVSDRVNDTRPVSEQHESLTHSVSIHEIAAALAKAQGKITGALKDSANPFFKSKYADLASCWDACRQPLSENALAVIQGDAADDQGVTVTTLLAHSSGQWLRSQLRLTPKDSTPQGIGSAITYGRRYGLTSMIGIAQVDDDGNQASGKNEGHNPRGDMGKDVPAEEVMRAAATMRDILDADFQEDVRALKVLDYHDVLNKNQDLYVAAAEELSPKLRAAWKTYLALAKNREKADRAGGRR